MPYDRFEILDIQEYKLLIWEGGTNFSLKGKKNIKGILVNQRPYGD